ncbi:LysR family transcriptional regulator [Ancylobacter sonchi]|uniref:LysR family transcriptional regulator n=1 Tax=Ancylobacter sonchi TaxID=1937790 RepID=UPI001BD1C947|nr:LysR family transcriptional regulator [Ancylobacter sonchi]MBS7535374.1 LysR family transcriptional regulator [Ancylobacter sonchi]
MDETTCKIILELHRTANITRAADRLAMTQPALSKRLQAIERDFGVQLVVRTQKGVAFTPEGEYLAREADKVLAHFGEIRTQLMSFGDRAGTIRLGVTNSFARYTLPPCLKRYRASSPDVTFDISTGVSADIVKLVEDGRVHVGFIYGDFDGHFERMLIGQEQACLVNREKIELAELPATPQISYLSDPFAKRLLQDWWHSHFAAPMLIGMRANHGDTCLEMIANGLGYGIFLSPKFVDRSDRLYTMPLDNADGTPFARKAWMIWRREFAGIALISRFIAFATENRDVFDCR